MVVSIYGDDQKKRNFLIKQSYKCGVGSRVESGSDDPDYLGHLGHIFGGSSGSHPQTKLSECDLDF